MLGKLGVYILLFTLRKLGVLKSNNPLFTIALCTLLPIPRLGVMALVHLGFDALLISAFLAGVKRTTGLTYVNLACSTRSVSDWACAAPHWDKYLIRTSVVSTPLLFWLSELCLIWLNSDAQNFSDNISNSASTCLISLWCSLGCVCLSVHLSILQ